jgi:hypothetical protein
MGALVRVVVELGEGTRSASIAAVTRDRLPAGSGQFRPTHLGVEDIDVTRRRAPDENLEGFGNITKPESTDWLGLIELGALEAAGMGADGRQGVERLRSPVKGPCEIKAR